jgi:hypothetical protein
VYVNNGYSHYWPWYWFASNNNQQPQTNYNTQTQVPDNYNASTPDDGNHAGLWALGTFVIGMAVVFVWFKKKEWI